MKRTLENTETDTQETRRTSPEVRKQIVPNPSSLFEHVSTAESFMTLNVRRTLWRFHPDAATFAT